MLLGCILSIFRGYEQHPKLSSSAEVTHHALNAILVLAVDLLRRQTHPVPFELQRECTRVASYLIRQSSGGPERSRKRMTPGGFPPCRRFRTPFNAFGPHPLRSYFDARDRNAFYGSDAVDDRVGSIWESKGGFGVPFEPE
ncbi:hypothetical protein MVLG_03017 [Microbotryum lychnidis-dioicae p1A1 Lamole]|uniref:Uncharacterized protein n=1 Tax=Microbotryum lychnidis-dioicae (strain p1A1 Lamole / MvSl-1064) TaxID=683840 RepID=U5H6X6_USTV1|nr:hypothetical protein MVLG_03017 [Microbotryum lychnidis-dioicae p1A1 Lamole]|eukprot:KDE06670.1 hypothetical protein MVLG_03017 [Microbotryum lychnidis-dioicae p1A1 Lamole]